MRATCRTFRDALDSEVVHLSAHNTSAVLTLDQLVAKIVRCSPSLRSLHLHGLYTTNPTALARLMAALRQCHRLEVLWTVPLTGRADMHMDLSTLSALRCVMVPVSRMSVRQIVTGGVADWNAALIREPKGTHSMDSCLTARAKGSLLDGPLPHPVCVFVHGSKCPGPVTIDADTSLLGLLLHQAVPDLPPALLSLLRTHDFARRTSVTLPKITVHYHAINCPVTLNHVRHVLVPHGARRLYMVLPHVTVAEHNHVCLWVPPRWCAEVRRWLSPRMDVCALVKARTVL